MICPAIGAASVPPTAPGEIMAGLSKPSQTPVTNSGVIPTNHTSVLSLVVPVFPATGMRAGTIVRSAVAVPRVTTSCSMSRMMNATRGSIADRAGATCGVNTVRPLRSSIRCTKRGSTATPPLSNAAYAATKSSGCTTLAPSALDGYGAIGERKPARRANAITESIPTASASCTATGLRDFVSASRNVSAPRNALSALSGLYVCPLSRRMRSAVSATMALAVSPCAMLCAYTNALKLDPGCRLPSTARLNELRA